MIGPFSRLHRAFERFSSWFDLRFGWFFTNGMKERDQGARRPAKA